MLHDEGIKFLSLVMTLDENVTVQVHNTVKNNILAAPNSWHVKYGEIYFRAWQGLSGDRRERFERACIQKYMDHAVHAQPELFPTLKRLLSYIHGQKKQRGVEDMLCNLYAPIMWRSLHVANSQVRANTATLFFDMFPLQGTEMTVQEADAELQKQFDLLSVLLDDPMPKVRVVSVVGVFRVMRDFWEMIPSDSLRSLTLKLIQDLLNDSSSADVRESVIKGLNLLLDNPLCHPFLKPLLPEIRNHFHDMSELVRIEMLNLLLKVKTLRTIKFWTIVPIDHLLARLVVDSEPVNKRIVKLIFNNFVPQDATAAVKLSRCLALMELNPAAARQFFRLASQHMATEDIVEYINILCKTILQAIKNVGGQTESEQSGDQVNQTDPDDENNLELSGSINNTTTNVAGDDADDDDAIRLSNVPVMLGLCEVICVLWTFNEEQLNKASNADLKKVLMKRFTYALPEMFKAFSDSRIIAVLLQIAGYLPPKWIPTVSRSWLPKLRKMTSANTVSDYGPLVECLCKTGQVESVLELVTEWIQPALDVTPLQKTGRGRPDSGRVKFVETHVPEPGLGLALLSHMLTQTLTQGILLQHVTRNLAIRDLLANSVVKLTEMLEGKADEKSDSNIILEAFNIYCKLLLLLHAQDKRTLSCLSEYGKLLSWADKHVVPVLGLKQEDEQSKQAQLAHNIVQNVLTIVSNMFLIGVGAELGLTVIDFCTLCLANDPDLGLLSVVLLSLYQVVELSRYQGDAMWITPQTLSSALARVFLNIAGYVKHHPKDSMKVLSSVKEHMSELLKTVYSRVSLDETVAHEVMSTILAAVFAEMDHSSKQNDLEEEATLATLPPISAWLLDILARKLHLLQEFTQELKAICDTGIVTDMYKTDAILHLVLAVAHERKIDSAGLRGILDHIDRQMPRLLAEMSEEETEDIKSLIGVVKEKLKKCESALGLASS
ncbi:condensin-2 complex subunit G2-like isoform X39 [Dreissena polymorpha]|nr:condensin-2 complex subunit G2-like isoform X2 [Dreissena polymorpha]XP_052253349.1 condensin-2 complex subunit G2-like isoform X3 [Dreissena polymorpha]XP_052253350.1 condensin-2 complex subunit G2-like isoform X4 [Dreissena polymorpha]XP_052253351.1 condensin-2 complex subunit G2-like isoform X5 [Dreissena polymorpha]XP_052253352.1 condensin-2 complex subunit G2-like isoform X6 [Dreissena polymorpha]XP_052253353.1 condensin-2 complex subunit G2-like isoform X7 [Dreissena polymorpha]XP_05